MTSRPKEGASASHINLDSHPVVSAPAFNEDAFRLSYALFKQLNSAYAITSNYGDIQLDDELHAAIDGVVRPILQRRLAEAENRPAPLDGEG